MKLLFLVILLLALEGCQGSGRFRLRKLGHSRFQNESCKWEHATIAVGGALMGAAAAYTSHRRMDEFAGKRSSAHRPHRHSCRGLRR